MDRELQLRFSPERMRMRHTTADRLSAAGAIAAEMLGTAHSEEERPSSQEIAAAIVHWLKTGERGQ
jgi:hypothetical protein